jgi:hypothetical protein
LAPDDPVAQVRSMLRWRDGFVATGAVVVTGETSATPIWVSSDGGSWRRLGPEALGASTVVLGVGETAGGLVALTLQGGEDTCPFQLDACVVLSLPLQAWTSPDGLAWTAHPGPRLELVEGCEGCGFDWPVFSAGPAGLLLMTEYREAATSSDGVAWELLPSGTIPPGINPATVTRFGSGFVGVGVRRVTINGIETRKPIAITSSDGRDWAVHPIRVADFDPRSGAAADRLVAGPDGLIARGGTGGAPGFQLWWSSLDGVSWTQLSEYPPLGAWVGEAQGSGVSPNGTLVGNEDRMLAYRANAPETAWTSFDGASWLPLAIEGDRPDWEGTDTQYPELLLTPAGVLGFGRDGAAWFGEPLID